MTINAPVVVLVLEAVLVIDMALVVVAPRLVIDCSVLIFHIVTAPVAVLIAVSVPPIIDDTELACSDTRYPLEYISRALSTPSIPTPPLTYRALLAVLTKLDNVLVTTIVPTVRVLVILALSATVKPTLVPVTLRYENIP